MQVDQAMNGVHQDQPNAGGPQRIQAVLNENKMVLTLVGTAVCIIILAIILLLTVFLKGSGSTRHFRVENSTLIDFNLQDRERSISFHLSYTVTGNSSPNISTVVSLEGLNGFVLASVFLPPAPDDIQPKGEEYAWFVDLQDTLRMNFTEFRGLALQIRDGKVIFDIRIQDSGYTTTCPVEATLPGKVTKARKCRKYFKAL